VTDVKTGDMVRVHRIQQSRQVTAIGYESPGWVKLTFAGPDEYEYVHVRKTVIVDEAD
jgi:hypothetical protein